MKAEKECFECCRNKVSGLLEQYHASESVQAAVLEQMERVLDSAEEKSAPVLMAEVISAAEAHLKVSDSYQYPKKKYNRILMRQEEEIRQEIAGEKDPFLAGLQYAVTGNYIDFGAMSEVKEEKLGELLSKRGEIRLSEEELEYLRADLANAKRLAYITDNAGEIVLDKIFLEVVKEFYPNLEVGVIVRGAPVLNDATYIDAKAVGLTEIASVIPNGTDVPGTPLDQVNETALTWIESADLCIAKGQGNFETLRGCGKNVFYLFLCKCELFVRKFRVGRFTPVLSNEIRIVQYE
ncbi:hypothetical protein C806_03502 [Lachnospiraceae bacterium 3-1]|nr:hypothetical protein C806_03502 [Lachnospiraceae bacterium 3-1]